MYLSFRVSCHMVISCRILSWIRIARARVQVPVQDVLPSGDGEDLLLMRFLSTACAPRLYSKAPTCTSRACAGRLKASPRVMWSLSTLTSTVRCCAGPRATRRGLEGCDCWGQVCAVHERAALFRESSGLAIRMSHLVDGDLPALSGVLDGTIYAQTLPSLVAAHVLAAQPGERVLDMCGAPGSKTTHVATNFLRGRRGLSARHMRAQPWQTEPNGAAVHGDIWAELRPADQGGHDEAGRSRGGGHRTFAAAVVFVAHCGERVRE